MIHIGSPKTLKTRCGKPVARRWWVSNERVRFGRHGPLGVYEVVNPKVSATCPKCLGVKRAKRGAK